MTTNFETTTEATFEKLGTPPQILATLAKINFNTPTPIQQQAIPPALAGRDILGSAQTGTGKTAAFTIPMLAHLLANPKSMTTVLAPTRELATQIMQAVIQMSDPAARIRCALLIGGDSMTRQLHALQQKPRVIIGTPGRINDHLARRSLNLSNADFLVLDETDRMLDMGFGVQIDKILAHMPKQRQTLLFSATLPPHITKLADRYLRNPERIAVGSTTAPIAKIKQETLEIEQAQKHEALMAELDKRAGTIIVFVKTKRGADRIAQKLTREKYSADAIHGDLRQNQRDKAIRRFREGQTRILVATDVAARGLDIPHIEHVINYDLPQCPEDYIHRIGRTGRNGAEGSALAFISPEQRGLWNDIQRLLNPSERPERSEGRRQPGKTRKGGGFKGGFKHKRKEWSGPNRHRDNRDEGRNEGRNAPRNERGNEGRNADRRPRRDGEQFIRQHNDSGEVWSNNGPQRENRSERPARNDRPQRSDRPQRDNRGPRPERFERAERSDRPSEARPERKFNNGEKRQDGRKHFSGKGSSPRNDRKFAA